MIIIVYPLQAQQDYTELMYSLRSVEKFFTVPYEVVIVGSVIPDWITGVTQIIVGDIPNRKQLTIKKKIYAALCYADKIFFMNDDFVLLKETDGTWPYYYYGTLAHWGESGAKPLMVALTQMGKKILNFDIHTPIIYEKKFIDCFQYFLSDVIVKSCYSNYFEVDGVPGTDVKINKAMKETEIESLIFDKAVLSTGFSGLKSVVPVLEKLFPDKSKFEI